MLLFVPVGAVVGVDGGKPTSRGLPPAAFWGTGRCGSMQTHPHPTSMGAAVPAASAVGAGLTHPSPMSREPQCGPPVPLAPCSRTQAPRAGGLGASFRSEWGGDGS